MVGMLVCKNNGRNILEHFGLNGTLDKGKDAGIKKDFFVSLFYHKTRMNVLIDTHVFSLQSSLLSRKYHIYVYDGQIGIVSLMCLAGEEIPL
jgi:hypothetical protein